VADRPRDDVFDMFSPHYGFDWQNYAEFSNVSARELVVKR